MGQAAGYSAWGDRRRKGRTAANAREQCGRAFGIEHGRGGGTSGSAANGVSGDRRSSQYARRYYGAAIRAHDRIAPSNDVSHGDPSNPATAFPSVRDPAASAVLGPRPDDASKAAGSQESFAAAMDSAKGMLGEGKLVEALRKLTKWYGNPQLNADESRQLMDLLGQLAGTVVYSRQHLLQPPYKVQPGDKLETIAAQYNVPWQLLAKINGIEDPNRLSPGEELKVVRGPFAAIVDLDKRQLTLIVDDCYAGRFNLVGVGDLARNIEGRSFDVGEKMLHGPVSGLESSPIHHWVRLGNETWIVGTSDPATLHPAGLNLNSRDAEDVYDILSVGSRVVVRR